MSDDESTVDNKTVSGNDVNEDTNVNKEIKEAKSIPKKEKKKHKVSLKIIVIQQVK